MNSFVTILLIALNLIVCIYLFGKQSDEDMTNEGINEAVIRTVISMPQAR